MKIKLVHTSISGIGYDSFGEIRDMESTWWDGGLCYLSSYAKQEGFDDIELIDLRKLKSDNNFYLRLLRETDIDVIGMPCLSADVDHVQELAKIIKECLPQCIVVIGGKHPSMLPLTFIDNINIDYIVVGEGEITFAKLLKSLNQGDPPIDKILIGERADLNKLPFLDYELYPDEQLPFPIQHIDPEIKAPFITFTCFRGCVYNCGFCKPGDETVFGKRTRLRSPERVIEELKWVRENYYDFNSFFEISSNFLQLPSWWIKRFCELYKESGFKAMGKIQARADLMCHKESLMPLLRETMVSWISIGYESGNQRILDMMNKGTTVEENYKAGEICQKYGFKQWANLILGWPTETNEEAEDTLEMANKIEPEHLSWAFLTPFPGTHLWDYAIENDLMFTTDKSEHWRCDPSRGKIKGIDYKFLQQLIQKSYAEQSRRYQV